MKNTQSGGVEKHLKERTAALSKSYMQIPEVKDRRSVYMATNDKAYRQVPEVKERARERDRNRAPSGRQEYNQLYREIKNALIHQGKSGAHARRQRKHQPSFRPSQETTSMLTI